jgi:hypothetical protein
MACRICKKECEEDFCDDCLWMLDFLHDRYSLAEQSKIFTYALGSKAVQEITEKMADRLFEAYGADVLNETRTTNMQ